MRSAIALLAALLLKSFFANAMVLKKGSVQFTAVGNPGFLKIKGESRQTYVLGELKLEKNSLNATFEFALRSLSTGIELRDEHMKEKYLEVKKYPKAILKLLPIKISQEKLLKTHSGNFQGDLTLHGVTKPVNGKYRYNAEKKNISA